MQNNINIQNAVISNCQSKLYQFLQPNDTQDVHDFGRARHAAVGDVCAEARPAVGRCRTGAAMDSKVASTRCPAKLQYVSPCADGLNPSPLIIKSVPPATGPTSGEISLTRVLRYKNRVWLSVNCCTFIVTSTSTKPSARSGVWQAISAGEMKVAGTLVMLNLQKR